MELNTSNSNNSTRDESGKSRANSILGVIIILFIVAVSFYAIMKAGDNNTSRAKSVQGDSDTTVDLETAYDSTATSETETDTNLNNSEETTMANKKKEITKGLTYVDTKVGTGAEAKSGKEITVHYTGTLTNGTKFDSSVDRGQPFTFGLGAGQVIQGWDLGFAGMKVGGKRTLTIAPELGYGNRAIGSIPANSTLIFEVELLEVE